MPRADDWTWNEPDLSPGDFPLLMGIDPATFAHFVTAKFKAGSIDEITGTDVAVIAGKATIGQEELRTAQARQAHRILIASPRRIEE